MHLLLGGLLLRLDHLLDDLRFLYQECSEDALLHAACAPRTTIRPTNTLLCLRDGRILTGSECWDTGESNSAITAFGGSRKLFEVVVDKLATWSLDHSSAVGSGVVGSTLAESDTLSHWRGYEGGHISI